MLVYHKSRYMGFFYDPIALLTLYHYIIWQSNSQIYGFWSFSFFCYWSFWNILSFETKPDAFVSNFLRPWLKNRGTPRVCNNFPSFVAGHFGGYIYIYIYYIYSCMLVKWHIIWYVMNIKIWDIANIWIIMDLHLLSYYVKSGSWATSFILYPVIYIYILYIIIYSQHLRVAHTATYTVN